MGDSWEDDDFEVPVLPTAPVKKFDDEDELDLEREKEIKPPQPSAAQIAAAAQKKKEEEIKLANAVKYASLENETADERRARERRQVEEADNELTGELFGGKADGATTSGKSTGSLTAGIAGATLKSKDDHKNFGVVVAKKLTDSTAFNIAAFYKSLTDKVESKLTYETVDEIITALNKVKESKKKIAEPAKTTGAKKSKSQLKAETKKHNDVFGGVDDYDKYEDYNASEYSSIGNSTVPTVGNSIDSCWLAILHSAPQTSLLLHLTLYLSPPSRRLSHFKRIELSPIFYTNTVEDDYM
jgi:Translation initiation factor eIF3 subunit